MPVGRGVAAVSTTAHAGLPRIVRAVRACVHCADRAANGAARTSLCSAVRSVRPQAHGLVGKRFFPATLTTEDPFVADELSLPTVSGRKLPASGEEPATRETTFSVDMSKRITENFGIAFGAPYKQLRPDDGATQRGFDNLAASVKYKFYQNDEREALLSGGIDWDIGGSGSKRVGAESFSTFTPALFFGKGFGDLPPDAQYLRPFAVTGQLGVGIPSRASTTTVGDARRDVSVERNPHVLQWGFAIEYSFPVSAILRAGRGSRRAVQSDDSAWSSSRCRRRSTAARAGRPER